MTSLAETPVPIFCSSCGEAAAEVPMTWTIQAGTRGVEYLCAACTRSHVRQIESQLPTEWWG